MPNSLQDFAADDAVAAISIDLLDAASVRLDQLVTTQADKSGHQILLVSCVVDTEVQETHQKDGAPHTYAATTAKTIHVC